VQWRTAGNTVAASAVIPELYLVPGAVRKVAIPVPPLSPGRYIALAVLDYGGPDLAAAQLPYEVR